MESGSEPSYEELTLLLAAKDATITAQATLIEQLAARVEELERRLGKDSSNSSRPPSSDPAFAKPAPKRSSRTLSGKRRGKQNGAPGTTLRLVEDPDEIVRREPAACCGCGADLVHALVFDERRHQVFDVPPPPPRPHVTEYRIAAKTCARCGSTTVGDIPAWARGRAHAGRSSPPAPRGWYARTTCQYAAPPACCGSCSARTCPPASSPRCAPARPGCWCRHSCPGYGS